jgi:hypothetical protein
MYKQMNAHTLNTTPQLTCNVIWIVCFVTSADDASDVPVRHLESLFLRWILDA